MIGCEELTVEIAPRGEGIVSQGARVEASTVRVTRTLDRASSVFATIPSGCCEIADVGCWSHELVVRRGDVPVFCGPVVGITVEASRETTVEAAGWLAWLARRLVSADRDWLAADPVQIVADLIADAHLVEPLPFSVQATLSGLAVDRQVRVEDRRTVWAEVEQLARETVDVVEDGRDVLVSGLEVPVLDVGVMRGDQFLEPPRLVIRGDEVTTRAHVVGREVEASADGDIATFGLLERVERAGEILDLLSAQTLADGIVALEGRASMILEAGWLAETFPVSVEDLIPGARVEALFPDEFFCVDVPTLWRVQTVTIEHERVGVTLQGEGLR